PDGRLIAAHGDFRPTGFRVWDAATGQLRPTLVAEFYWLPSGLAFSADSRRLARSLNNTAFVLDVETGKGLQRFTHNQTISAVAFHPDGKRLASADGGGIIKLWDEGTGRELRTYRGHSRNCTGLVFSRDGRWFVTANQDGTVRIWDATMTPRDW